MGSIRRRSQRRIVGAWGRRARNRGPVGWLALVVAAGLAVPTDLALLGLSAAGVFIHAALPELPDTRRLYDIRYQEPLRIYSADGSMMAEFGIQRRQPVTFDEVPMTLIQAFLAAEDSRFFDHQGIDWVGLVRAAVDVAGSGRASQGGSTITMQLTRNLFLTREKTLQRKVTELLLALRVEQALSKEEILEVYLNEIFFGHRAYGVSAAADLYYGKELADLTLAEMAMLAGIPKSPSTVNPLADPERARGRRDHILRRMLELDFIDERVYQQAVSEADRALLHRSPPDLAAGYVAEMARREVVERYGEQVYRRGLRVYTTVDPHLQLRAQAAVRNGLLDYDQRHGYRGPEGRLEQSRTHRSDWDAALAALPVLPELEAGLVVSVGHRSAEVYLGQGRSVTLSLEAVRWARPYLGPDARGPVPRRVSDTLAAGDLIRLRREGSGPLSLAQAPDVAGALVALAPQDGAILALMGGYDFRDSPFNRAVDARRQPGSSFKPFIYAAALDRGWTPASILRDEPIRVPQGRGRYWEPQNADRRTMGPIRLRVALVKSRNLATIDLLNRLGVAEARQFLPRFGFAPESLPHGLSLALGTGSASPLQMAAAYAVFANGGFRVTPYLIQRIEDSEGWTIFEASPPRACSDCWYRYGAAPATTQPLAGTPAAAAERVLDPRLAFQMTSLLRDVIERGTAQRAKALRRSDVVGKTGTTNDVRDSWFCGFQKEVVAVSWMGFDGFTPLGRGEYGGRAALAVWLDFMAEALKDKPEALLGPPPGLVKVRFDKDSGAETQSDGPNTVEEWVAEEFRPIQQAAELSPDVDAGRGADPPGTAATVLDTLF